MPPFLSLLRGFGFVEITGESEDIFVHEEDTLHAFHKDIVKVQIKKEKTGSRREGRIIEIMEHGVAEVVGTFEESRNFGFVVPDNFKIPQDIFIPREHTMGAKDKDKVIVKLVSYGDKNKSPEGRVKEILGAMGEPGIDVLSIAKSYELPMEFPHQLLHHKIFFHL